MFNQLHNFITFFAWVREVSSDVTLLYDQIRSETIKENKIKNEQKMSKDMKKRKDHIDGYEDGYIAR